MLEVRSEYLNERYLASYDTDTVDPCSSCFLGQQVVIHWCLPTYIKNPTTCFFVLTLRYGNHTTEEVKVPLNQASGWWIFRLLNCDYWDRGGILTYKVDLYEGDVLLDSWRHHVWTEILNL